MTELRSLSPDSKQIIFEIGFSLLPDVKNIISYSCWARAGGWVSEHRIDMDENTNDIDIKKEINLRQLNAIQDIVAKMVQEMS